MASCVQVAEAALCVLCAILLRAGVRADMKRLLCKTVVAVGLHQSLLALLHVHPLSQGASKVCLVASCGMSINQVAFYSISQLRLPYLAAAVECSDMDGDR